MPLPRLPRVAVLLSTYNGERVLQAQLDSLVAQEGVAIEVFARDDGSSDGTLSILSSYARHWPRLATPMKGEHLGIAASYLNLLKTAPEGFDGYAFCDQDDVWLPEKLSWAMARLTNADSARPTIFCSSVICVDDTLQRIGEIVLSHDTRFEHLLFENIMFGATSTMNSAARTIICSKIPDTSAIMPDWWCALVLSAFGDILCDRRPTILYRQHDANTTGASPNYLSELVNRFRQLLKDPGGVYRIHAQASELLRLHGTGLSPSQRSLVEKFVASRGSLGRRLKYALFGRVVRSDIPRAVAARILIASGLY